MDETKGVYRNRFTANLSQRAITSSVLEVELPKRMAFGQHISRLSIRKRRSWPKSGPAALGNTPERMQGCEDMRLGKIRTSTAHVWEENGPRIIRNTTGNNPVMCLSCTAFLISCLNGPKPIRTSGYVESRGTHRADVGVSMAERLNHPTTRDITTPNTRGGHRLTRMAEAMSSDSDDDDMDWEPSPSMHQQRRKRRRSVPTYSIQPRPNGSVRFDVLAPITSRISLFSRHSLAFRLLPIQIDDRKALCCMLSRPDEIQMSFSDELPFRWHSER